MSRFRAERMHVVLSAPAYMQDAEKALIYGFVAARAPERVLEVGTHEGGATAVLCAALDDVGHGRLVTVDEAPRLPPAMWHVLHHRTAQVADLDGARAALDGPVDIVLLTHPLTPEDVAEPLDALDLASGAHVLVHDAHHDGVARGVEQVLAASRFVDGGLLVTERTEEGGSTWGGLRLLHHP